MLSLAWLLFLSEEAHDESLATGGELDDVPIHYAGSNHRFRAS